MFNFFSKAEFSPNKIINILRSSYFRPFNNKAKRIKGYLEKYPGVTSLNLSINNLAAKDIQVLIEGLKGTTISDLNLMSCRIGAEGAQALAEGLKGTNLISLKLAFNKIGAEGAQVLAEALKGTKVTILDLRYNNIGDKGAQALAEGLKSTNVKSLNLSRNDISNKGAKDLVQALKGTNVTNLGLSGNLIKNSVRREIVFMCSVNMKRIADEMHDAVSPQNGLAQSKGPSSKAGQAEKSRPGLLKFTLLGLAYLMMIITTRPVVRTGVGLVAFLAATRAGVYLAARSGVVIPAALAPVALVASSFGLIGLVLAPIRRFFKSSKEASYVSKTNEELDALTPEHLTAFLDGVEAQKSYAAQAESCFRFNDYRHGNAFYAGMGAQANQNEELIAKVKAHKPSA